MKIIFFGSTHDSVIVCDALFSHTKKLKATVQTVVTQPAKPIGRNQVLTPTDVETWAKTHTVTCLTFESQKEKPWLYEYEEHVIQTISSFSPDLLISASYGQKIPESCIEKAKFGGLNIHPSILPRWRGTDPIPWTILSGDAETGVSIVTLSKKFDEGTILAQQKIPLDKTSTPDEIRSHLFTLGASQLTDLLPGYCSGVLKGIPQDTTHATYARRLTKIDGFIPWDILVDALQGNAIPQEKYPNILTYAKTSLPVSISRAVRAISPWPGVWSIISMNKGYGINLLAQACLRKQAGNKGEEKRLKILKVHVENGKLVIDTVQLEGKKPTEFSTFAKAYKFTLDNPNTEPYARGWRIA